MPLAAKLHEITAPSLPTAHPMARLSLWLKKTEVILGLPLEAAPLLRSMESPIPSSEVAGRLGIDFLARIIQAEAVDILHDRRVRWRPGRFLIQSEDGLSNRLTRPHEAMIELTSRCNFSCPYCCLGELPTVGSKFDMLPQLFDDLVSQFLRKPVFRLSITGGEPLLWAKRHRTLFSGLERIRNAGSFLTLFTNGVFLDDFRAEVEACFDKIVVSLDAIKQPDFRAMSGQAGRELRRVKANVGDFARTTNIQVNTVVCNLNLSNTADVVRWCRAAGVASVHLTREFGLGRASAGYTAVTENEWNALGAELKEMAASEGFNISRIDRKQSIAKDFPYGPCKVGRAYFLINYQGSVLPCIGYKADIKGNVNEKSIDDIWMEGEWSAYRDADAPCPVIRQQKLLATFRSSQPLTAKL